MPAFFPQTCRRAFVLLTLFAATVASPRAFSQENPQQDGPPRQHPLVPAIEMCQASRQVLAQLTDYTATLIKQERINGQLISQRISLKLQEQPFSVYMKFETPHTGREILFVQGQNNNQLLAHEAQGVASLVGTVSLAINSPQVTAENRHPITDVGIRKMLDLVIAQWQFETQFGEVNVNYYPEAKLGNAPCDVIEVSHPRPYKQFPFHMTRLFIEKQSRLPIRVENYGFPEAANQPGPLMEEYTYLNVRTNVGLTAADFDRRNQNYAFR